MFKKLCLVVAFGLLLALSAACGSISSEARPFETEHFTFTIPAGWQTMAEVWDRPAAPEDDYYGLGLQEQVMIQYPPEQRQGKAFFAVASSPLAEGETLEGRFTQAYQLAVPEIEEASQASFALGDHSGYEITYRRPWGEPWWNFRDIWLEKEGVIYVLSFHATPGSFDSYAETLDQILESFSFKE
jgi:hypothetical protein